MVPIENSIEGSVSATVDMLAHEVDNLQIVREVRHPDPPLPPDPTRG